MVGYSQNLLLLYILLCVVILILVCVIAHLNKVHFMGFLRSYIKSVCLLVCDHHLTKCEWHVNETINLDKLTISQNTTLNDLRKIICSRKSEVSVERVSACNDIENLAEHGTHCTPFSYTNDVININIYIYIVLGGVVEVVSSIPAVGHKIFFSIFGIFDI